jgi:predicted CoA-substrate-specific enzyme activase
MHIVGIDIGSLSIASVALDSNGEIVASDYRFHQGEPERSLKESLNALGIPSARALVRTGRGPDLLRSPWETEENVAAIKAVNRAFPEAGSLLTVGAETFSIIHFGEDGSYKRMRSNSSCAAGTGSFLDQQARRLSLADSSELSRMALANDGAVPKIASRCAVFAKTDLIHAQAEGYSLNEICDGLCLGLAKNIVDTLVSDEAPPLPLVFAGGVSRNGAVLKHLESLLNTTIITHPQAPLFGAWGAALAWIDGEASRKNDEASLDTGADPREFLLSDMVRTEKKSRDYYYQPLALSLSDYPDFRGEQSSLFSTRDDLKVETDIYTVPEKGAEIPVYLGIDIGSTSTKAVLSGIDGEKVWAGFYTRTAGKPLKAVQGIFETVRHVEQRLGVQFLARGAATTGSGRKFVGKVVGADLAVDEITAHARAAFQLDPEIDTIIEIGGQDSKFTTMREGMVTFSQMNTICAAGTGSFLEEQAQKLGVPLDQYSLRAENRPAPLTSDRCTVFMERDINNYLNQDYSVDEVLAAALFSVRENYLQKVAGEANIGSHVCFQGATAKNKALVAAFEQKLQRPLFVSKYCHLTGALGAALIVGEEISSTTDASKTTSFRGLDLYQKQIPVRNETCELCTNHCRLRIAEVQGDTVAFGFLCGRDYSTQSWVDTNRSRFDLLKSRKRIFRYASRPARLTYAVDSEHAETAALPVIGLPAALHMVEQLPFWQHFFAELGFPVITSEKMESPIKRGKSLTGAEFCAPMTALHGHTDYLIEKNDILFLPFSMEAQKEKYEEAWLRKYCYYTQYAPGLIKAISSRKSSSIVLTPLIKPGNFPHNIQELNRCLSPWLTRKSAIIDIARAFSAAWQYMEEKKEQLAELFQREFTPPGEESGEISALLVGRPYTVLSPGMNNRIPDIFGTMGVKVFFQDMIPVTPEARKGIEPILSAFHWHYAADILEASAMAAKTAGLYPVYITSFKCSPDSFALDYFKRIMEAEQKPYLILQLDEHDSSVGYETRIEAGIRAFRNHARKEQAQSAAAGRKAEGELPVEDKPPRGEQQKKGFFGKLPSLTLPAFSMPSFNLPSIKLPRLPFPTFPGRKSAAPLLDTELDGKTLLFPNWDPATSPLLVANLRREGIDARLLPESPTSIQKSMRINSGQCLPVSIVSQEAMDYVREQKLDPARTTLWIARGKIACNIPMYPWYMKNAFEEEGGGMEKLGVYVGDISHMEISPILAVHTYFAYMFGGLLRRLGCRVRPYEINKGETAGALKESYRELESTFLGGGNFEAAIQTIIHRFEAIPTEGAERPKVAIFGDLYVRDNDVMNQDLIGTIEAAGGEVITTPYNEYAKIIAPAYYRKWFRNGEYLNWLKNRSLMAAAALIEKKYYAHFREFFAPGEATSGARIEELLSRFNMTLEHDGESMENILKIFHILEEHKDVALFVQTSPSYCCPALITEAMSRDIERATGVPVISLTYDGTGTPQNQRVVPYILYRTGRASKQLQKSL